MFCATETITTFTCQGVNCGFQTKVSDLAIKHSAECDKIQCKNHGCPVLDTKKELYLHHDSKCDFLLVECYYCNAKIIAKDIFHHKEFCNKTTIMCVYCEESMDRYTYKYDDHAKKCMQEHNEAFVLMKTLLGESLIEKMTNMNSALDEHDVEERAKLSGKLRRVLAKMFNQGI
jgi:hypothetical protein